MAKRSDYLAGHRHRLVPECGQFLQQTADWLGPGLRPGRKCLAADAGNDRNETQPTGCSPKISSHFYVLTLGDFETGISFGM